MTKKLTALILAVFMGLTALAAAEFEPRLDTSVEGSIRVAGSYSNFEALEEQFDLFNEYYPNVELTYEYLDDYNNVIDIVVISEECPDIVMTKPYHWNTENERYYELQQAAEDLSDPALGICYDTIVDGMIITREDGSVPNLPMFLTTGGILVNEKIFSDLGLKVPETLSELREVCEALKAAGYVSPIVGYDRGSDMYQNVAYALLLLSLQENPEAAQAFEEMTSGEAARAGVELMRDFVENGYINREYCKAELADNYNAAILRFFEGDIPMMACNTGTVSGTAKRESRSEAFMANPFPYSFYVVPVTEQGGYICTEYSESLTVNTNSSNLDLANEFMRFVSQPENLNQMAERKGMPSVTTVSNPGSKFASLTAYVENHTLYTADIGITNEMLAQYRRMLEIAARSDTPVDDIIAGFPYENQ